MRTFVRLAQIGIALGLIGLIALVVMVAVARSELPSYTDLKNIEQGQMIRVRAVDGTIIQEIGPSYGRWLPSSEIPQVMKDAMISIEDRRYRSHLGIDPKGLARAIYFAWQNRNTDRRLQGASTITQQLARTIFLNNSYSTGRKIREAILAMAMESKFSKDQILELYLNKVYFGGGAYGIDAASRKFFDHGATQLSLGEAAIIAGLVKAPSNYSPTADAQAAIGRASVVLKAMEQTGVITPGQSASIEPADVALAPEPPQNSVRYFTDWALPQLDTLIDETVKPIDVWTTVDLSMQRLATAAIQANVPSGAQGALVSMENDGAVRAMVGGSDYVSSNYNRAVTAVRQPGSSWKLFVYLAALESGYSPDDVVTDEPVQIDGWTPRNSGGSYAGAMSVRNAFAYSKNTVAAQIGNEVGFNTVAGMARRFGISTPINTHPAMVLGTSEVRLIDMTRAFAEISDGGRAINPYGIIKVTTIDNEVLYERRDRPGAALVDDYVAATMTDLLQTAVQAGTGRAAQIGRPAAGKTGTTTSNKDGTFFGFSSGLTTGVWMGRDDAKAVRGLQGGTAPARAWAAFMKGATADRPVQKFDTEVTLPDWQLEDDEGAFYGAPEDGAFSDEYGMPIEGNPPTGDGRLPAQDEPVLNQSWIDRALGRGQQRQDQQPARRPDQGQIPAPGTPRRPDATQVPPQPRNDERPSEQGEDELIY
nr:PBP1A family penicillin-binding protein [Novosphingopyxis iocasae]